MRFGTRRTVDGTGQGTIAVRIEDDHVVDLPVADVGELLCSAPEVRRAEGPRTPLKDVRWAPVVTNPAKVVCVGHNYRAHIAELGQDEPTAPTLFSKWADTLLGAGEPLELPTSSAQVDWEAELAVVVGSTLRRACRDEADAAIGGWTIANDVSMRDWQKRTGQWLAGKAFDASTPLGPWLVTPDTWSPEGQTIRCLLDGEVVQEGDPADLVFDAATLLADISTFTTLRPGDVLLTGTPGGVGMARTPPRWLAPGSELVTEITGLGRITTPLIEERS